jgi:ribosomal protein S18 acetylase RimI-like enzyme
VIGGLSVGLRGAIRYLTYEHHVAPHHPREPHWYLFVLGVEPEWQGRGVGSALLARFYEKASASGRPAYLETDLHSSVRLYERHGFVVVQEFDVAPLGGLHVWTMRRG